MSETIRAIVYSAHGKPQEVLQLEEQSLGGLGPDEALVRLRAAPVNPADLNQIEGKYPVRAPLPATPGFEGAGVVEEVGGNVKGLSVGDQVILPHDLGTWRELALVKADKLMVVPKEIVPEQAAMLKINPLTAWRMLHDFVELKKGDWVIQNAANSAAGQCVIQIAKELGYRTFNLVRRPELIAELEALGADVVVLDDEKMREELGAATGKTPPRLALNAVSGESATRMAKGLADEATMVTYGAMSLQPLAIPNGLLIFKNLCFTGFWVNKWYDHATKEERDLTFAHLFDLSKRGLLQTKIEHLYSLGEFKEAVSRASEGKRGGKIVFRCS